MQQAVELSRQETPSDYEPFGNLGDAYQLSGDSLDKAAQAWRQALEIVDRRVKAEPENFELLATRGLYRAKIGQTDTAIQDAERARTSAPNNATVSYLAALAFAVSGSDARAREAIQAAVKLGFSVEEIRHAPEFSVMRRDPGFERILNRAATR